MNNPQYNADKVSLSDQVFRDPSEKLEDIWRVYWQGFVCKPTFNSKGAAEAFLDGLRKGRAPA